MQSLPPGLTSSTHLGGQNHWHSFVSERMPTCVILDHEIEMLVLCCVSLHPLPFPPIAPHPIPCCITATIAPHVTQILYHCKVGCLCRLRLCWDRVLDPAAKHVQLDKRVRGAQANVDLSHLRKPEPGGDQAASSSSSDQDSDHQVTMTHSLCKLHRQAMCNSPGPAAEMPL